MRVSIDTNRCEGHGRCLQYASDVFGYDDVTNNAFVITDADVDSNRAKIQDAILGCPEQAISLVEDDRPITET